MIRQPLTADWYWTIGDDYSRAWSSRLRAFVSSGDIPEDVAPTPVATLADLIAMFERAGAPDLAPLNANHVRRECQRRMVALTGARDAADLTIKLSNAQREAIRLLRKGAENWTADETARAAYLEAADAAIELLRSRSNDMEGNPPADYQADERWA